MGAAIGYARTAQVPLAIAHVKIARDVLTAFPFVEQRGHTAVTREPIGVCALITPWNWPLYQITAKVAPALAAGCTVVLKPSELSPLSALLFAEAIEEAGFPAGVFNLVHGDGPGVGAGLASHPDVDMISITGSTRAGIAVAAGSRADGQARRAGTRRQVAERDPARRRPRSRRFSGHSRRASAISASRAAPRRA